MATRQHIGKIWRMIKQSTLSCTQLRDGQDAYWIHCEESAQIDVTRKLHWHARQWHTHGIGEGFGGDLLTSTQGE